MSGQRALFTELEKKPSQVVPRGFRYQEDAISEEEQNVLVTAIQSLDLKPFEFHGYIGNRRVINFGFKYDFTRRFVERANDMPHFLNELLGRVAEFAGNSRDAFRQVGINEYQVGAGIGWHKDKPEFGIIVGVSLLAPATMRFRKKENDNWVRISHTLKPRSIYFLSGQARTEWEHSVPPLDSLRYAITFRTLADAFLSKKDGNSRDLR
jgi:alkylated DNA repair dioxygenase AlkB